LSAQFDIAAAWFQFRKIRAIRGRLFLALAPSLSQNFLMIARVWHGTTTPENADSYESMLKPELLPGISKVPGFKGSYFLRRNVGDEVEFITILLWESLDALKAFAGPNYEVSIIPEERRKYLKRHDESAQHFEVISHP
jgi:antibiotic biosynthesis monooxygenase (ABM) superfamily enzyme